jgi:hypothetical protein
MHHHVKQAAASLTLQQLPALLRGDVADERPAAAAAAAMQVVVFLQ